MFLGIYSFLPGCPFVTMVSFKQHWSFYLWNILRSLECGRSVYALGLPIIQSDSSVKLFNLLPLILPIIEGC